MAGSSAVVHWPKGETANACDQSRPQPGPAASAEADPRRTLAEQRGGVRREVKG